MTTPRIMDLHMDVRKTKWTENIHGILKEYLLHTFPLNNIEEIMLVSAITDYWFKQGR